MVATVHSRRPLHVRVPREMSPLAGVAWRVAVFAALLLVMTILARRAGIIGVFELVAPIGVAGATGLVALALALLALTDCLLRGSAGGWRAIRAAALALVVAVPFVLGAVRYVLNPAVNDVSTDVVTPPSITASEQPRPTPADLVARRYDATIERVNAAVRETLVELGWEIGAEQGRAEPADAGGPALPPEEIADVIPVPRMRAPTAEQIALLEAAARERAAALAAERREEEAVLELSMTVRTPVLRLVSDVVVRLRDDGETTTIDVRSRSREGRHDLGRNADHVRTFLAALDETMARQGLQ